MKISLRLICAYVLTLCWQGFSAPLTLSAQRELLISACQQKRTDKFPILGEALKSENPIICRTAARLLAQQGPKGLDILKAQFGTQTDALVERIALLEWFRQTSDYHYVQMGLKSGNSLTRYIFALYMEKDSAKPEAVIATLGLLEKDESSKVRAVATRCVWPFHRDNIPIKNRKDFDYDVKMLAASALDNNGWKFRLDPNGQGHILGWFAHGYDDKEWNDIAIGASCEGKGYDYDGAAWYRRKFRMDKPDDCIAVELDFKGVDECAWVWLNGVYIGQHDIGPVGWDKPFQLDITQEINWDGDNTIAVRVLDSAWAGGIYEPIALIFYGKAH